MKAHREAGESCMLHLSLCLSDSLFLGRADREKPVSSAQDVTLSGTKPRMGLCSQSRTPCRARRIGSRVVRKCALCFEEEWTGSCGLMRVFKGVGGERKSTCGTGGVWVNGPIPGGVVHAEAARSLLYVTCVGDEATIFFFFFFLFTALPAFAF